ncbi:MAG: amino acid adenylation domain-containing protein [Gemmatimonadaceae bacterium]
MRSRTVSESPRTGRPLSPERRRLLDNLLRARGVSVPEVIPPIPRGRRDQPLPLSSAQQRLWFLEQLTAGGNAYTDCYAIRLHGSLDQATLERALAEIMRRHEALRTTFGLSNGRPTQVIHPPVAIALGVENLMPCAASERDAVLQRIALDEARRPLNLERGPLLRTRLLRFEADEHVLLLVIHHIISDGQSYLMLFSELAAIYAAFADALPSPLPEPITQLADYAAWEQQRLRDGTLEPQLDFWRGQLGTRTTIATMPTDRPRSAVQTYRGAGQTLELSPSIAEGVAALCRRESLTPFMVLLSAFQVLLHSFSGETNVVVGAPVANRGYPGTEGVFGFLVNTLILRVDLSGDPRVGDLLMRTRDACLAALSNQDVPFDAVVQSLRVKRDLASSPLFQTCVVEQRMASQLRAGPLIMTDILVDYGIARFDIALWIIRDEGPVQDPGSRIGNSRRLALRLQYNTDLFQPATVARMLRELELIVGYLVAPGAESLKTVRGALEVFRRPDQNAGAASVANRRVHEHFENQVALTPGAIAVVCGEREVSYNELNTRAGNLALRLQAQGVGPGVLVGLCCERSVDMIVGILGILKSGGAYVPLDPSYPADRLAFVLDDTQSAVLVTQQKYIATLPRYQARTVLLDGTGDDAGTSDAQAVNHGSPSDAAYVIYTSGSTGQPKGVVVTHANLAHSNAARLVFYRERVRCYLLLSSFAFDSSVAGIFWTLLDGGTLVIPAEGAERDPRQIVDLIARHHVSHTLTLPSFYKLLLDDSPDLNRLSSLLAVIVAGDACPADLVERHFRRMPAAALYNEYGPTEGTVWCTAHRCEPEDALGRVPIGRPIPGTSIHIVDDSMTPVAAGETGELYVGGPGVASGYLRRPELTADKFVPDPFSPDASARLYKTGDVARFRDDGVIEFLGRVDQQVKIRGYRVELGEIEAALADHTAVWEAAVVARPDAQGEPRLVAYIVAAGVAPGSAELRRFLSQLLPDYMVPAVFTVLPAMPLTPTGKVDRNALPAPDSDRPELDNAYVPPRTALERMLAELWTDVLGVQAVGVDDNFFELGGNSIQAAILINRLQTRLGEYIHVATIFREPRISGFAAMLAEQYPAAVAAVTGAEPLPSASPQDSLVGVAQIAQFRSLIPGISPRQRGAPASLRNPPAVFVLSPPRSGSTLLRVILAGNPSLFVPPELELLNFNTMADRAAEFTGAERYLAEGLLRAVMQIEECDAEKAQTIVESHERAAATTQEFYRWMQQRIGGRLLVDKTAGYSVDLATLRRAESDFDGAMYIHLVRHPMAVIRSFQKVHLDQVFFRHAHPFTPRQLAELLWIVCNQNIADLLVGVPAHRQRRVRFEDLVSQPDATIRALCHWLQIPFVADMLRPYDDPAVRMTDATSVHSRMQGDPVFHQHTAIDAGAAGMWREVGRNGGNPGSAAAQLASAFGYQDASDDEVDDSSVRLPAASGPLPDAGGANVGELSDEEVREMLEALLSTTKADQ